MFPSRMANDAPQATKKQTEHNTSEEEKSKDMPPKTREGKDDTATLNYQLLSALEKHEK